MQFYENAILIDAGPRRSEIVGLRLCDVGRELALQADRAHLSDLVPVPELVPGLPEGISRRCNRTWSLDAHTSSPHEVIGAIR